MQGGYSIGGVIKHVTISINLTFSNIMKLLSLVWIYKVSIFKQANKKNLTTWLIKAELSVGEFGSEIWPHTNKGPESGTWVEVSSFNGLDKSAWLCDDAVSTNKNLVINQRQSRNEMAYCLIVTEAP